MKKEFLELSKLQTETQALSEGLSIMVLEKVDSLYAKAVRQCAPVTSLGTGHSPESKNVNCCRVTTCSCGSCC